MGAAVEVPLQNYYSSAAEILDEYYCYCHCYYYGDAYARQLLPPALPPTRMRVVSRVCEDEELLLL